MDVNSSAGKDRTTGVNQNEAARNTHILVSEAIDRARRYTTSILPIAKLALIVLPFVPLLAGRLYHAAALAMICVGLGITLTAWCHSRRATLPLILLLSLQDWLWYGTPLLVNHKSLQDYPDIMVLRSGVCLLIYLVSMAFFRRVVQRRPPPRHRQALALDVSGRDESGPLRIVLIGGLALCSLLEWAFATGSIWPYIARLPHGSVNVIRTALAAGECGAGFLFAFQWGRKTLPVNIRVSITILFALILSARIASVLLSSTVAVIGAVLLGVYLGTGRIPWRAIAITVLGLSFLNLGKFDMRSRYWNSSNQKLTIYTASEYFSEWISASGSKLFNPKSKDGHNVASRDDGQTLAERLSNIQMLLYADRAINQHNYPLLWGKTYQASWHVLVPRFLWPNKPRSHIGQEILNVHFDRQTRAETFRTYIAWGLVPEAVGNFGIWVGPVFLGAILGCGLGWVEHYTSDLPLFSLPSILASFLMISLTGSSGMVAGVWVATLIQTSAILCIGLYPFMRWVRL